MHESDAGHDAQNSWPVGISGLGVGVTDQPGTGGLADAALTEAPAPAAGPSNTTAAPMATAARHIRPRIANPPLPGKSCSLARVTADKPEQQQPTPGERCTETNEEPAPLRAKRCTEAKSPSMSGPASLSWLTLAFASMGSAVTRRYGPLPGRADLPVQSSWAAVRHRRRSAACGDEGAGGSHSLADAGNCRASASARTGRPGRAKDADSAIRRRGATISPVTRRNLHCMALDVRYPPDLERCYRFAGIRVHRAEPGIMWPGEVRA